MKSRTTRLKSMTALWPLMRDPKIPFWAKAAIPAVAAAYVISPIDLVPDFLLGVGQVDDIGVILLAASASVALLQKFFANQEAAPEPARASSTESANGTTVYEATYRVK
ncbi:MAG: YkvA family protein [Thermomicrobiales bacterium]